MRSACTAASRRRRVRLLLFIAAPVALCAPTPDTHQQHILTAWEAGTPATWKGFAERPSPAAATATAAGDAARATRAATLAAIQAAGREAAAELDAAAAKLDAAHCGTLPGARPGPVELKLACHCSGR